MDKISTRWILRHKVQWNYFLLQDINANKIEMLENDKPTF